MADIYLSITIGGTVHFANPDALKVCPASLKANYSLTIFGNTGQPGGYTQGGPADYLLWCSSSVREIHGRHPGEGISRQGSEEEGWKVGCEERHQRELQEAEQVRIKC